MIRPVAVSITPGGLNHESRGASGASSRPSRSSVGRKLRWSPSEWNWSNGISLSGTAIQRHTEQAILSAFHHFNDETPARRIGDRALAFANLPSLAA